MKKGKANKLTKGIQLQILLVVAIGVLINVAVQPLSMRWDATDDKLYTLSEASKTIVQSIEDPLTIKLLFSSELPQHMLVTQREVYDLAEEYVAAGLGQVSVELSNPDTDDVAADEVEAYGIPEIQFNVIEEDKYEVSSGYAGLVLLYQDKQEIIPIVSTTDGLEYDISVSIRKMSSDELPPVMIVDGGGVQSTAQLEAVLSDRYAVQHVGVGDLYTETGTALFVGPTENLSEAELYSLDQFVLKGGKLIVLVDTQTVDEAALTRSENETNITELLDSYGIEVQDDTVADYELGQVITITTETGPVTAQYPFLPAITNQFNEDHPISGSVSFAALPWPSSIKVDIEEDASGNRLRLVEDTDLVSTSLRAYGFTNDLVGLRPEDVFEPAGQRQLTLATILEGEFNSAYENADALGGSEYAHIPSTLEGTLMVVGNARFINDPLLSGNPANAELVFNAIDVFSQDDALIATRSKTLSAAPIDTLKEEKKRMVKYVNIGSVVVLVIILYMIVRKKRKRRSKKVRNAYVNN